MANELSVNNGIIINPLAGNTDKIVVLESSGKLAASNVLVSTIPTSSDLINLRNSAYHVSIPISGGNFSWNHAVTDPSFTAANATFTKSPNYYTFTPTGDDAYIYSSTLSPKLYPATCNVFAITYKGDDSNSHSIQVFAQKEGDSQVQRGSITLPGSTSWVTYIYSFENVADWLNNGPYVSVRFDINNGGGGQIGRNLYLKSILIGESSYTDPNSAESKTELLAVYDHTNQTFNQGDNTRVQYDTKKYDKYNSVTTGTSWVFTAPYSGFFDFNLTLDFDTGTSGVAYRFWALTSFVNDSEGVAIRDGNIYVPDYTNIAHNRQFHGVKLSKNDTIYFKFYHNSDAALVTQSTTVYYRSNITIHGSRKN